MSYGHFGTKEDTKHWATVSIGPSQWQLVSNSQVTRMTDL